MLFFSSPLFSWFGIAFNSERFLGRYFRFLIWEICWGHKRLLEVNLRWEFGFGWWLIWMGLGSDYWKAIVWVSLRLKGTPFNVALWFQIEILVYIPKLDLPTCNRPQNATNFPPTALSNLIRQYRFHFQFNLPRYLWTEIEINTPKLHQIKYLPINQFTVKFVMTDSNRNHNKKYLFRAIRFNWNQEREKNAVTIVISCKLNGQLYKHTEQIVCGFLDPLETERVWDYFDKASIKSIKNKPNIWMGMINSIWI